MKCLGESEEERLVVAVAGRVGGRDKLALVEVTARAANGHPPSSSCGHGQHPSPHGHQSSFQRVLRFQSKVLSIAMFVFLGHNPCCTSFSLATSQLRTTSPCLTTSSPCIFLSKWVASTCKRLGNGMPAITKHLTSLSRHPALTPYFLLFFISESLPMIDS